MNPQIEAYFFAQLERSLQLARERLDDPMRWQPTPFTANEVVEALEQAIAVVQIAQRYVIEEIGN